MHGHNFFCLVDLSDNDLVCRPYDLILGPVFPVGEF